MVTVNGDIFDAVRHTHTTGTGLLTSALIGGASRHCTMTFSAVVTLPITMPDMSVAARIMNLYRVFMVYEHVIINTSRAKTVNMAVKWSRGRMDGNGRRY